MEQIGVGYGVVSRPVATIYDRPATTKKGAKGTVSAIADEMPYGSPFRILERLGDWMRIRTFYGYEGYLPRADYLPLRDMEGYIGSHFAVVDKACADVLNCPAVQGVPLLTLPREALVLVSANVEDGWTRLRLLDGREGYLSQSHLAQKRFSFPFLQQEPGNTCEAFSFQDVLERWYGGSEALFRRALVETAERWLGTQYRWGGRCGFGVDCSGLVSLVYQRCGVTIYRDAALKEGYPMKALPIVRTADGKFDPATLEGDLLRPGDALYFPGHIALYTGDGEYLHATGRAGSHGVVRNSLRPDSPLYRADLVESLTAAGGLRLDAEE